VQSGAKPIAAPHCASVAIASLHGGWVDPSARHALSPMMPGSCGSMVTPPPSSAAAAASMVSQYAVEYWSAQSIWAWTSGVTALGSPHAAEFTWIGTPAFA
jgi:hypothetical protein